MTSTTTRQAIAAQDRSLPGRVTGRLKRALDFMVWEAASRKNAAERAGMTDHSLRQALKRPHVIRYYTAELGIRRTSAKAKNLDRLEAIRDQDENRGAAVKAIQVLEQLDDQERAPGGAGMATSVGLVIIVGREKPAEVQAKTIDVTPRAPVQPAIDHVASEGIDAIDEPEPISEPALAAELSEDQPLDEWMRENAIRIEPGVRLAPPNTKGIAELQAERQPRERRRGNRRRVE